MHKHSKLVLATLAMSAAAFAQTDGPFLIGYAANLTAGGGTVNNSVLNMSNDGYLAGFYPNSGALLGNTGNICVNVYTFNQDEEMMSCCSCLVTPNGLNSLPVQGVPPNGGGLVNNQLTPPTPGQNSVVIKLVSTTPETPTSGPNTTVPTQCNAGGPVGGFTVPAGVPTGADQVTKGMVAWGSTEEPTGVPGQFVTVAVPYLSGSLNTTLPTAAASELSALTTVCSFVQAIGSGFGKCGPVDSDVCGPNGASSGGLAGAKN